MAIVGSSGPGGGMMAFGGTSTGAITPMTPSGRVALPGQTYSQSQGENQSTQQSTSRSMSQSYIPDYAESPILRSIAQQAQSMAPQVYQWGMDQFNKNQGNIDTMMRNALTYASPQRVAQEMGRAEAGVMQGAEAGRQSAIKDLQSYGIDPSSGRYASLDQASRVMAGASAAGAGNQQREATTAQGAQMAGQAQDLSLKNVQTGYGASNAANALLGTAMQLKYPPLGTTSSSSSDSSGQSTGYTISESGSQQQPSGGGGGGTDWWARTMLQGSPGRAAAEGGHIDDGESPTGGAAVDDVPANLTAGEFVIPKDVAEWKGQEFFYKLMAQARKMRATAGSETGTDVGYQNGNGQEAGMSQEPGMQQEPVEATGYAGGGNVLSPGALPDQMLPWWRTMLGGAPGRAA